MTLVPVMLVALTIDQLPSSPDPKPVPVTGVVVDGTGSPIADADIWLAEAIRLAEGRRSGSELLGPIPIRPGMMAPPALAHVRTDAAGHFTIDLPADIVARRSPPPLAVWAAANGTDTRVAWHRLPPIVLTDDPPVRIKLNPTTRTEIFVLGPDQKPVGGARIIPIRVGEILIPEPLGRLLAAKSDATGRATIPGLAPEALGEVNVEAAGFGAQIMEIPGPGFPIPNSKLAFSANETTTISLAPPGRVVGRLVSPGLGPIKGVTVRASSQVDGYASSGRGGSALVSCDERGRFEIPAVAAGMLTLAPEFAAERGTTLRSWPIGRILVRAGRTTEVVIPLHPTVKLQGQVRERKTERPIAGVTVFWNGTFDGWNLSVSDAGGGLRGFVPREDTVAMPFPIGIPSPYFMPGDWSHAHKDLPPRGVDEQTLAPIELSRGVEVSGLVVDQSGKTVAGAVVEAIRPTSLVSAQLTRSDRAGRFVLHGVDPRDELSLTAWDDLASSSPVAIGAEALAIGAEALATGPIRLTIGPGHAMPIGGRVVDTAGRPIAGASVRIWRQVRVKDRGGRVLVMDPITFASGSTVTRTDPRGRYRTSRRFPDDCAYYVEASAPSRPTARSSILTPGARDREVPPVVLRRLRTIEGQVVDSRGRPVAGALVFQSGDGPIRTEIPSDEQGRFRLAGILEGPALVFARKDGFRLGFVACSASTGDGDPPPVEVTLTRHGEPPAVSYKTLPSALPADEEKALALRLFRPHADQVLAQANVRQQFLFLLDMAGFDPLETLERLETAKHVDPDDVGSIRIAAAEAFAKENLDEAMAIAEGCATADIRAQAYMAVSDALPTLGTARARPVLDQAIVNMRATKSSYMRLTLLSRIIGRLIDLGEIERARSLVREGRELARAGLPGTPFAWERAEFIGVLLRLDPEKERAAFEDLKQEYLRGEVTVRTFAFDSHYVRAAYHFAARDPATAETFARLVSFTLPYRANRYVMAVCVRMAPADLPRARKLVDLITDDERVLRPYTLGLMAGAIAASGRPAANRLLDDAYAELERLAADGWTGQFAGICGVAGALLPVVEQFDADRLPEFLARALALRPPTGDRNEASYIPEESTSLAMMVASYDRGLAARILQPVLDGLGAAPSPTASLSYSVVGQGSDRRALVALALIDPRQAVERIERLPEETGTRTLKGEARDGAARILTLQGDARWSHVCERELFLWTPRQGIQ